MLLTMPCLSVSCCFLHLTIPGEPLSSLTLGAPVALLILASSKRSVLLFPPASKILPELLLLPQIHSLLVLSSQDVCCLLSHHSDALHLLPRSRSRPY